MPVKQLVNAPMRRLLADKTLHLRGKFLTLLLRQSLETGAHRVDEILLAQRKAHRQSAEKRRAKGVAPVPARLKGGGEVHEQTPHYQLSHCKTPLTSQARHSGRSLPPCYLYRLNTQVYCETAALPRLSLALRGAMSRRRRSLACYAPARPARCPARQRPAKAPD